jgi:hypothetical protein
MCEKIVSHTFALNAKRCTSGIDASEPGETMGKRKRGSAKPTNTTRYLQKSNPNEHNPIFFFQA